MFLPLRVQWKDEFEVTPVTNTVIYPAADGWLSVGAGSDTYSQNGEDGLIAKALQRIGAQSRFCFEVGAGDGKHLSNTLLLRDAGWSALLIEREIVRYMKCAESYDSEAVVCVHADITEDGLLDKLIGDCAVDFGVIDVDCQDWRVWNGLKAQPRLMLVEYNFTNDLPPPPTDADTARLQAGLSAILSLGADKGYIPLVRTLCNVLFTKESEL